MPHVVITGSNRGIGLELARAFALRGDEVTVAVRRSSAELDALGVEVHEHIDVSTDTGIAALVAAVGPRRIDLLVNNAGIMTRETLDELDLARIRRQFEVNALAPLRITQALRELIPEGGKVVMISTRAGSIGDNGSGGLYGYRMSKAALNMAGVSLARDLAPAGVCVLLLHPGFVRTELTGGQGMMDPAESAAKLLVLIDRLGIADTGTFWHPDGYQLPW